MLGNTPHILCNSITSSHVDCTLATAEHITDTAMESFENHFLTDLPVEIITKIQNECKEKINDVTRVKEQKDGYNYSVGLLNRISEQLGALIRLFSSSHSHLINQLNHTIPTTHILKQKGLFSSQSIPTLPLTTLVYTKAVQISWHFRTT
jgi:hypothetical protein